MISVYTKMPCQQVRKVSVTSRKMKVERVLTLCLVSFLMQGVLKIRISLERHSSALKSDKSANYVSLDGKESIES